MATIIMKQLQNGKFTYTIRFYLHRKRKDLILGSKYPSPKMGEKYPKQIVEMDWVVEDLKKYHEKGITLPKKTEGFIDEMTDELKENFFRCGLLEKSESVTLEELWKRFFDETENSRKSNSNIAFTTTRKQFFSFFPAGGDPADLTKRNGEDWKGFLEERGYAEASIAGFLVKTNTVLNWAVEQGYLGKNPFKGIKRGSFSNPDRQFYVPMEWYHKLLDACPDQTWRTILALCRIGGLRNPSETLRLTWADVDWSNGSILVHSSKTEHHEGKKTRLIPMFHKLREQLERQWDQTKEGGSPYVIDKWRDTSANMRTQFHRIIFRAGLPEWERTFQNLRESRANEIWSKYPDHVAQAWMGHSKRVAQKHYLEVTDGQFQSALSEGIDSAGETGKPADPPATWVG